MKIIKRLMPVILVLGLSACTSPTANMPQASISQLSNNQLCQLQGAYMFEPKLEVEIGKRNLNCDPAFNHCLQQGTKPNTPQMLLCMTQIRENWELKRQAKIREQELKDENRRLKLKEDAYRLNKRR